MSLFNELKRRNVVKMAVLYLVAAWLLLQLTDVFSSLLPVPAWAGSLVVMLLALGFPFTLIFSWVYEITPDGLKREKDMDRGKSVTKATGRKINILIIVLLVLAITSVAVDRLIPELEPVAESAITDEYPNTETKVVDVAPPVADSSATVEDRSIAVLPFANRSARDDDIYFVDGIHDDILTQLARIGSLTVISRTSVEKFRDTSKSMREIGAVLGVKNVLEGGVQRAGDRVRINVQLIDVMTDDHLWAESYDRELSTDNIFAIQSEISGAIASALNATLSIEEQQQIGTVPTENMAALEAYFLGRRAMAVRSSTSLTEAEQQFNAAIALDSNYAQAYVGLANTYTLQVLYSGLSIDEQKARSETQLNKALGINDLLGEAYIAQAYMEHIAAGFTFSGDDNFEALKRLFVKGIGLAPSDATSHHWYAAFLIDNGHTDEALAELEQAARLDPLSSIIRNDLGQLMEHEGRFDEARQQYQAVIDIDPAFAVGYLSLGRLAIVAAGRLDEAVFWLRQAVALDQGNPRITMLLASVWSHFGNEPEVDLWLNRTQAIVGANGLMTHFSAGFVAFSKGEIRLALPHARAILDAIPNDHLALQIVSHNDWESGRAADGVERYRSAYPAFLDDPDPGLTDTDVFATNHLAFLLKSTGNDVRAELLLDRAMEVIQTMPRLGSNGYGIADVQILMMRGQKNDALAALRQAVDEQWRALWRFELEHNPILAPLHDMPEYQTIVAELEADMVAQLERIREMEANGELPPIPE